MKNYKTLIAELSEAMWPGTPEYKKKFGETPSDNGSRHKIDRTSGVVRATRKYEPGSGESEEPTKNREDAAAAPVKRGRGRPPGKYGSYKKKIKESLEILEALDTEEDIQEFIFSLDEESFAELEQYLSLDEAEDWGSYTKKQFKRREMEQELGHEVAPQRAATSDSPHAVHINGRKWKTFGSKSHATNVANKIKGATVVRESLEDDLDEAMSVQAKTTMKHVKNATPGEKQAAKDIKPGIAGYRDRIAMLQSAAARGGLKNEGVEELDELSKSTLGSYAKKASLDSAMRMGNAAVSGDLKAAEKAGKRYGNVVKAVDRLTKEEAEIDEKYMGMEKLSSSLAAKGARDPKALAAWIGRKKYGKAEFQKAAAKGVKIRESEVEELLEKTTVVGAATPHGEDTKGRSAGVLSAGVAGVSTQHEHEGKKYTVTTEVDHGGDIHHDISHEGKRIHGHMVTKEYGSSKKRYGDKPSPLHTKLIADHVRAAKPHLTNMADHIFPGKTAKNESEVDEALKHPNQKVLDKNNNNKLDKEDFAILRGEKKAPMKEETTDDSIAQIAAFITKQAKGEA